MSDKAQDPFREIKWVVEMALEEDRASRDTTTEAVLRGEKGTAEIRAEADGVLAGADVLEMVFLTQDPTLEFTVHLRDGSRFKSGDLVATIKGEIASILRAERTALNFLMHLSGVATQTAKFVDAIEGSGVTVLDTRKTIPLLRDLQKSAVRAGGGVNHRRNLEEMLLVKSNHIRAVGSISEAVRRVRESHPDRYLEVEVRDLEELNEALRLPIDRVMLDNFSPQDVAEAKRRSAGKVPLEASGRITLDTVRKYAFAGADFVSIGALTHSAPALPFSLKIIDTTALASSK
ncbi:MAG: carboxylating nicotinate-nucleotide diphosphorylase [bacterium JZ-2024 1]